MDSVGYKYLEHSTDAFVQVQGSTLEELFEKCAEGFVNIMFDIDKVKKRRSVAIAAEGDDLEGLLYDWLEKVLLKILIEHVVLSRFSVKICERPPFGEEKSYSLEARAEGEKVSYEKHNYKIEIKAITYHELKIRHLRNRYLATFLVDL